MEQTLSAEGHRRIQGLLRERYIVCVSSLSDLMGVSEVALESADREDEQLLLGGQYRARSNSTVGPFTTDVLRRGRSTA